MSQIITIAHSSDLCILKFDLMGESHMVAATVRNNCTVLEFMIMGEENVLKSNVIHCVLTKAELYSNCLWVIEEYLDIMTKEMADQEAEAIKMYQQKNAYKFN